MSNQKIPSLIKYFVYCQILARLMVTYCYYCDPSLLFPDVSLDSVSSKTGFYLAASRQFAISLSLILGILSKNPLFLALIMFVGFTVEAQDSIICYVENQPILTVMGAALVALIELYCSIVLYKMSIEKRNK